MYFSAEDGEDGVRVAYFMCFIENKSVARKGADEGAMREELFKVGDVDG